MLLPLNMKLLLIQTCCKWGGGQGMPPRFWQIRRHPWVMSALHITACPSKFLDFPRCLQYTCSLWACGPIMFALQVWVVFRASWRVPYLRKGLAKKSCSVSIPASYLEGHLASCSEGHFLRTLFGRTLFEAYVWKDTFQKLNSHINF